MPSPDVSPRTHPSPSRVAWASIAVNVFLSLLNLAIAAASGSLAVAAEMVHNLVDLIASVAVLAGVKISERKSHAFPYGLYKVENLVAAGVALLIFFTAYEIAREALRTRATSATVNAWMLDGVALSAVVPLAFSFYEMRAGRALNSPSLMADAQEYRAHVFSSGVVFLALVGQAERQEMLSNPHKDVDKAKGIRVAEWLVGLKTDFVLLREDLHGKGPTYVFADAGVKARLTEATTLAQALAQQTGEPN